MHQQPGELYQAYAAWLKTKADLCQYMIQVINKEEVSDRFCMQLIAREFIGEQERMRVKKHKKKAQRMRRIS